MASDRARAPGRPLREIQELLYELITAPAGVARGLAARGLAPADLAAVVRGDDRLSAVERLDVYASMYFYRILEVLHDEYPRTAASLGEAGFHNLVTDYLLFARPAHPSLREVGARLPDILDRQPLGGGRPWLADLARLERAHREVFDGPDATPLTLDEVRALGPDQFVALEVVLVPARARLEARFAVSAMWEAGEGAPLAPEAGRELLLVWRQGFQARHRVIGDAAGPVDDAPARAFQILARWVDDGLLRRAEPA